MEEDGNTCEAPEHPPEETAVSKPEKIFYDIDSTRATVREYSWGTPFFLLPIAIIIKLLRVKLPSSSDDPPVNELDAFEVAELPEKELALLESLKTELESMGFCEPVFHRIEDPVHATLIDWITLRHVSGKAFVRIHYRLWTYNQKIKTCIFPVFFTELDDFRFIVSSSGKPDTLAPPSWIMNRRKNMACSKLWESHQGLLEAEAGKEKLVNDAAELRAAIGRQHAAVRDFHLKRGFFAPLPEELKTRNLSQFAEDGSVRPELSIEDSSVISEIRRLECQRSSWVSLLLLAAVTFALFMSLGAMKQPVRFILLLSAVLFVHEAGHFIVMKLIGYKNMRMFFIPFVGAAVSGQHYNVPGWKQSIVALAGPLPGIALGIVAAIAGLITENGFIKELALLLLVINGFNLIPVMPLDGGRVLHAVLFCRHPFLNVLSRVMAAAGFIGLGLILSDRVLTVVGALMAFGIPMAYKTSQIAVKLRKEGLSTVSNDSSIPDIAALKILDEVKKAFPRGINLKAKAQMIMHIFETLNAKPPNWLVSVLFVLVLFSMIVMSTVMASVMIVAKTGNIGDFISAAATRPEMTYEAGTAKIWRNADSPDLAAPADFTLAASFKKAADAEEVLESLKKITPPGTSILLFGQSLIVKLPFKNEEDVSKWLNKLERDGATDVFAVREGFDMYLSLSFLMPTEKAAEDLNNELLAYYSFCRNHNLVPEWSPSWDSGKKEIQEFKKARSTYGRILTMPQEQKEDAGEAKELNRKLQEALRRGDNAEVKILEDRQMQMWREKQKKHYEKICAMPDTDTEIVSLYQKWLDAIGPRKEEAEDIQKTIAARMGTAECVGQAPDVPCKIGVKGGWTSRAGLLCNVTCSSFDSGPEGINAIAEWLAKSKAIDIKYSLYRYRSEGEYDEDDEALDY